MCLLCDRSTTSTSSKHKVLYAHEIEPWSLLPLSRPEEFDDEYNRDGQVDRTSEIDVGSLTQHDDGRADLHGLLHCIIDVDDLRAG